MRCLSVCLVALTLFGVSPLDAQAQDKEGLSYLEMANRFADLATQIESRLSRGERANATLLGPLCIAYANLKQYAALFDCADKLDARLRGGDTSMESDYLTAGSSDATALPDMLRAQAHLELGDYEKSIEEGKRALNRVPDSLGFTTGIWPPVKYRLAIITNLAISAALSGNTERAKTYREKLEDFSVGIFGGAMWRPIRANGLARVYVANKQYDKAIDQLSGGGLDSFMLRLGDATNPFAYRGDSLTTMVELPKLFMLAKAQFETGKVAEAKSTFDKLFENKRLPELGDIYWLSLNERGRIAAADGDAAGAIDYWRKAVDVVEEQRASINTEASKIGFVGDKQMLYARLIAVLIEQGRAAEAFDYVERSKSRALVDMLASKKDFAAPDPAQARLVLAQLDAADLGARVPGEDVRREAQPAGARNLQLARQALQSAAPELSALVTVSTVPSTELRSLVGAEETLVEYYYQGNDLYAFILDRNRLLAARLDASGMAAQVQALRKTLEDTGSSAWQEGARGLYRRLWQPLEALIANKHVIVVAHGALHYLPFAALQDGDGKLLIDRYSLRFLPSASVLKYLRPAMQEKSGRLLALGNPDLDDPRLDLQFAEGEAKLVASLYPNSRLLLHKDASESNFKKIGGVFSRIHFASHGKFQADEPLKSGLYLAKDADNDGVLTVGELYSMNLDADLVTLSACETGLGKVANGDDVVGLARGFLYAGARSIVASLWSVDDHATAALMQAFYVNLASMNKEDALRQAQIAVRAAYPHPFYWAAFQLTGRAE